MKTVNNEYGMGFGAFNFNELLRLALLEIGATVYAIQWTAIFSKI